MLVSLDLVSSSLKHWQTFTFDALQCNNSDSGQLSKYHYDHPNHILSVNSNYKRIPIGWKAVKLNVNRICQLCCSIAKGSLDAYPCIILMLLYIYRVNPSPIDQSKSSEASYWNIQVASYAVQLPEDASMPIFASPFPPTLRALQFKLFSAT